MLRAIGDRVQDDYIVYLNDATDQLLQHQYDGQLTYSALQEAAVNLLHHSAAGWTQVSHLNLDASMKSDMIYRKFAFRNTVQKSKSYFLP